MPAHKKATDSQLLLSYATTHSIWKCASMLNMCGQSVHERLSKLGAIRSDAYTDSEKQLITNFYKTGFQIGELDAFCKVNKFLTTSVSRFAASAGLTVKSRKASSAVSEQMSVRHKKWHLENPHPKGYLGKKHSELAKNAISKRSLAAWKKMSEGERAERNFKIARTRHANGSLYRPRLGTTWKAAWRVIGGVRKYYRSRWEANYARYLEFQKVHGLIAIWSHEPETFWFKGVSRGCVSYLPDFKITNNDGAVEFHEVKGWMDDRSKTKIKRMAKYHPTVKLIVKDSAWFRANANKLKGIIHDWE